MEFVKIDCEQLSEMQDILTESAGYSVSLADELEYFDPANAHGWILVKNCDGQLKGFIRHFKQGSDWSVGEVFLKHGLEDRSALGQRLLADFIDAAKFPVGHRLRFDVHANDAALNEALEKSGFSQKRQQFRYFQHDLDHDIAGCPAAETARAEDSFEVAQALSNLHFVEESEAQKWIGSKSIRIVRDGDQVVAAAQLFENSESVEINRIATHPSYLRRGYGKKLLKEIISEMSGQSGKHLYLKVEDVRTPAISLYKGLGFTERCEKNQIWHSRWF